MTSRLVHNKNFVSIGLSLPPFPEMAHHAYRSFLEIFWAYDFFFYSSEFYNKKWPFAAHSAQ